MATFGETVRDWRRKRGLTVTKLAEQAGVRKGYISSIEHGRTRLPYEKNLVRLARALEIPPHYLRIGILPGRAERGSTVGQEVGWYIDDLLQGVSIQSRDRLIAELRGVCKDFLTRRFGPLPLPDSLAKTTPQDVVASEATPSADPMAPLEPIFKRLEEIVSQDRLRHRK